MKIQNQKPAVLEPTYKATVTGAFRWDENIKEMIVDPILTPLNPNNPVVIQDDNGNNISDTDLVVSINNCLGDQLDTHAEKYAKDILKHTLALYKTDLNVNSLFAVQAGEQAKLPLPSQTVIYTPAVDVIPACKKFLSGLIDENELFATFAYYAQPTTFGVYFTTEQAFEDFKNWLSIQIQTVSAVLPANTNTLLNNFQTLTLNNLTESLVLRGDTGQNNEEYSFARCLMHYFMQYKTVVSSAEFGFMPFTLSELLCPKTVVMVNIERHSHATAKQVADEWNLIRKSIQMKPNVLSNAAIQKLTSTARNLQKVATQAQMATQISAQTQKAKACKFMKTEPTGNDMVNFVKKILVKMAFVSKSENIYKLKKRSYNRPNRRQPDNPDLQGVSISQKYKPDIHLYLDTSGSISERNYQDMVKACILLAKKYDVNLYFNSWASDISQCTKLKTKGKSTKQIWKEFQKVPKVTGGTEIEPVWAFINASAKRKKELSIVMTDFEFCVPNHTIDHPKNLYYAPCSHMNYDSIKYYAQQLVDGLIAQDPNIRKKILM